MMLAVVTVVSGRHSHLRAQRTSLAGGRRRPDLHVVVAIDDEAVARVVQDGSALPTTVVGVDRSDGHLPLAAARNAGASVALAAGAELLVLLDVDCLADEGLLATYERVAQDPSAADSLLCGSVTYLPEGAGASPAELRRRRAPHPARPDPEPGAVLAGEYELFWSLSFAVTARTWQRIGGFCEEYLGYGAEDTDFAQVARDAGVRLNWVGGADAFHQYHPSVSPPVQHLADILRNGEIFARRWGWWPMTGWLQEFARLGLVVHSSGQWRRASPLRVLSVPASHPYVEAVRPDFVRAVAPDRVSGWAPDPALTRAGLDRWGPDTDVVHLHFGYEHLQPAELAAWIHEVAVRHLPVVLTVHDLRNPHLNSNERHEAQLRLLVAAADEVITLTHGAAAEIARTYGRTARVLPHPSLLTATSQGPRTEPGLVVLHVKSLRANVGPVGSLVEAVRDGAAAAGGRVRVDVHAEVADDPRLREVRRLADRGEVELSVHDRFDDDALIDYLSRAQVSVLPHAFGTHSGWLELCRDLGTRVVAPDCGYYAEQWKETVSYRHNEVDGLHAGSLADAVSKALTMPLLPPADRLTREVDRARIQAEHARTYSEVCR